MSPPNIDAAITEVEEAHAELRTAGERLKAAIANLLAMIEIEKVKSRSQPEAGDGRRA